MEENTYRLDKETIRIFQGLHQDDLREWDEEGNIALGVIVEAEPAALLMGSINRDFVWLDWLYVDPKFRRQGIATRLMNKFEESLEWVTEDNEIYAMFEGEELRRFFDKRGMEFPDEPEQYRFSDKLSNLIELPDAEKCDRIKKIQELTSKDLRNIGNEMVALENVSMPLVLPINPNEYLPESVVYLGDNGLSAAIFLKKDSIGISVAFAFLSGIDGKPLLLCISKAKDMLAAKYGMDVQMSITSLNKASERLAEKLFLGAKKEPMWLCKKWIY